MLKAMITFFSSVFEPDPMMEKWPEHPRRACLMSTAIAGVALCGGVYVAEVRDDPIAID